MPVVFRNVMLFVTIAWALSACGGGGEGGANQEPSPPPIDTTLDWDRDNWDEREWQ